MAQYTRFEKQYVVDVVVPQVTRMAGIVGNRNHAAWAGLAATMHQYLAARGLAKRLYTGPALYQYYHRKHSDTAHRRGDNDTHTVPTPLGVRPIYDIPLIQAGHTIPTAGPPGQGALAIGPGNPTRSGRESLAPGSQNIPRTSHKEGPKTQRQRRTYEEFAGDISDVVEDDENSNEELLFVGSSIRRNGPIQGSDSNSTAKNDQGDHNVADRGESPKRFKAASVAVAGRVARVEPGNPRSTKICGTPNGGANARSTGKPKSKLASSFGGSVARERNSVHPLQFQTSKPVIDENSKAFDVSSVMQSSDLETKKARVEKMSEIEMTEEESSEKFSSGT